MWKKVSVLEIFSLFILLGEVRRFLTRESNEDPRLRDLSRLLIYWLNEELAEERIVVSGEGIHCSNLPIGLVFSC